MAIHPFSREGLKIKTFLESTLGIQLNEQNAKLMNLLESEVLSNANQNKYDFLNNPIDDVKAYFVDLAAQSVNERLLGMYESTLANTSNIKEESDAFARATLAAKFISKVAPNALKKVSFKQLHILAKSGL